MTINKASAHFLTFDGLLGRGQFITDDFKVEEWADPSEGLCFVNRVFADRVQDIRSSLGHPMTINSGCRTQATNQRVRGHPRSLHLMVNPKHMYKGCLAVDISVEGWDEKALWKMYHLAKLSGFSIGHGYVVDSYGKAHGFLHMDYRQLIGLPTVEFTY